MPWLRHRTTWLAEANSNNYPGTAILFITCTLLALLGFTRSRYHNLAAGVETAWVPVLLDWLACFYPWVVLAPLVFGFERRFPLERGQLRRVIPALALGGIVLAAAAIPLRMGLLLLARILLRVVIPLAAPVGSGLLPEYGAQLFLFFLAVVAAYVIRNFIQKNNQERERDRLALEKLQLETSLRQAELEALRMRMNPHFLFNALQNISVLAEHDPPAASEMLARLGDLLRAALQTEFQAEVALETELALTQSYLDVEKVRFGDRLSVLMNLAPGTEHALVPALVLQPLVENAILHGLQTVHSGTIRVASALEKGQLILTVCDNGVGLPVEFLERLKLGVGLGSTRERLRHLYPKAHQFEVRRLDKGGTEIRMTLPFRLQEARTNDTDHEQPALANRR